VVIANKNILKENIIKKMKYYEKKGQNVTDGQGISWGAGLV